MAPKRTRSVEPAAPHTKRPKSSAESNLISRLSNELLLHILRDSGLNFADLKRFRLVCRQFSYGIVISIFFRTVHLSKFRRDLDGFLGIAQDPRLACEARVLVWHEVRERRPGISAYMDEKSEQRIAKKLEATLRRIDWVRDDDGPATDQEVLDLVQPGRHNSLTHTREVICQLYEATSKLTGLHTLVSQPMHPNRTLTLPSDKLNYPLTAEYLSLALEMSWDPWTWMNPQINPHEYVSRANWGFFNFLLPVTSRAQELGLKITSLSFTKECGLSSSFQLIAMLPSNHQYTKASRNLECIDLCIGKAEDRELHNLAKYLQDAKGLNSLSLCFGNGRAHSRRRVVNDIPLILASDPVDEDSYKLKWNVGSCPPETLHTLLAGKHLNPKHQWEKLHQLRLSNCIFPMKTLAMFMAGQAHSLKKLQFSECNITVRDIITIAKMDLDVNGVLELQEFRILQAEASEDDRFLQEGICRKRLTTVQRNGDIYKNWHCRVDEGMLINFINQSFRTKDAQKQSPANDFGRLLSSLDGRNYQFAKELWEVGLKVTAFTHHAMFESSSCHCQAIHTTEVNSAIPERFGETEVEPLDWKEDEFGRPPGYSAHIETAFHADGDYFPIEGDSEDEGASWYDDEDLFEECQPQWRWSVACDSKGEMYVLKRPAEDEEDDTFAQIHLLSRHCQADEEPHDLSSTSNPALNTRSHWYRTERWRFTRGDECAIDREPLEYWGDWPKEGDVIQETPFGSSLSFFMDSVMNEVDAGYPSCSDEYIRSHGGIRTDQFS